MKVVCGVLLKRELKQNQLLLFFQLHLEKQKFQHPSAKEARIFLKSFKALRQGRKHPKNLKESGELGLKKLQLQLNKSRSQRKKKFKWKHQKSKSGRLELKRLNK